MDPVPERSPGHLLMRRTSVVTAWFAILGGVGGLCGWIFGIRRLMDWDADGITVKTNTTICLIACGLALLLAIGPPSRKAVLRILAIIAGAIGALTLLEHVASIDLHIDNLLFQEAPHAPATSSPNRMGVPASMAFTLLGVAFWLVSLGPTERLWAARLGIVTLGIASLSLMGYIYGADQLYALPYVSGIALQTACMLAALGVGLVAAIPDQSVGHLLLRDDAGGMLLRRFLLPIILVPLVLGWLRVQGQLAGYYDTAFGTAAFALALIIIFCMMAWWTARGISRMAVEGQRTRIALQRRERDLSDFFDNASVGLHWAGPDGIIQRVNRTELDLLGYRESEYLGHHITEFHVDKQLIAEIMERLTAGETLHNVPATMLARDGSTRDVLISSNVLFEEGRFIHTRSFTRDVTREKNLANVLRESELKFRMMFESAPMGMSLTRMPAGVLVDVNEAFLTLIGYRKEEVLGRTSLDLGIVKDPEARTRRLQEYARGVRMPSGDVELLTRDGRTVVVSIGVQRIRVGGEDLLMTIMEDITERKVAEEELKEADRRKNEFLATLAHELRNPLAPLRSGVQLLVDDPHAVHQVAPMMERQLDHMVHLVDDLMDLSRISRGAIELRLERLEVSEAVLRAAEAVAPRLREQGHQLVVERSPSPLPVNGDLTRLTQIFGNLLDNALKYNDANGVITLRMGQQEAWAVISVSDTGIGLEADQRTRVFDIFSQVDRSSTSSRSGLGIGLHVVKRLVEMHGGSVEVDSAGRGCGSTFTVRLPLTEVPAPAAPADRAVNAALTPLRVMITDDNEDGASTLALVLRKAGHETVVNHRGAQALLEGERFGPQVVLLDIGMPEMDGYETCRRIRATAWGAQACVIALTGWGQESDRALAREAGFDDHLVKPVDVKTLLSALGRAFEQSAASSFKAR